MPIEGQGYSSLVGVRRLANAVALLLVLALWQIARTAGLPDYILGPIEILQHFLNEPKPPEMRRTLRDARCRTRGPTLGSNDARDVATTGIGVLGVAGRAFPRHPVVRLGVALDLRHDALLANGSFCGPPCLTLQSGCTIRPQLSTSRDIVRGSALTISFGGHPLDRKRFDP